MQPNHFCTRPLSKHVHTKRQSMKPAGGNQFMDHALQSAANKQVRTNPATQVAGRLESKEDKETPYTAGRNYHTELARGSRKASTTHSGNSCHSAWANGERVATVQGIKSVTQGWQDHIAKTYHITPTEVASCMHNLCSSWHCVTRRPTGTAVTATTCMHSCREHTSTLYATVALHNVVPGNVTVATRPKKESTAGLQDHCKKRITKQGRRAIAAAVGDRLTRAQLQR